MKIVLKTTMSRVTKAKITQKYGRKKTVKIPPENCTYDAWKHVLILKIDNITKTILIDQPLTHIDSVKITWDDYDRGEATIEVEGKYEVNAVGIDPGTNDMITLVDAENLRVLRVSNNGETRRLWELLKKDEEEYRRELALTTSAVVDQIVNYVKKYNIKRVAIGLGPAGNPREKNPVFYDFTEELINQLLLVLPRAGVEVKTVDEYLTSLVDAFSLEAITKKKFRGRRHGKHFYSPVAGWVDADVNAALNILRKAYGDETIIGFIRAYPNIEETIIYVNKVDSKKSPRIGTIEAVKKMLGKLRKIF